MRSIADRTVDRHPSTKFEGGLQLLHVAGDIVVNMAGDHGDQSTHEMKVVGYMLCIKRLQTPSTSYKPTLMRNISSSALISFPILFDSERNMIRKSARRSRIHSFSSSSVGSKTTNRLQVGPKPDRVRVAITFSVAVA